MSPGKLAAQVSHGSMAFLTKQLKKHCEIPDKCEFSESGEQYKNLDYFKCSAFITKECYEEWINGIFTKVVLEARNKNDLLKAQTLAESLGMKKDEDFFLIYDVCNTELQPEEENETILTCIGFKPMPSEVIDQIGKKYQLYKG